LLLRGTGCERPVRSILTFEWAFLCSELDQSRVGSRVATDRRNSSRT